ncbi:MAG: TonB family protein [Chitinophagales bacterium]
MKRYFAYISVVLLLFCHYHSPLASNLVLANDNNQKKKVKASKTNSPSINIEPNKEEKPKLIKIQRLLRANSALKKFSGVAIWAKAGEPLYLYTTKYANLDYRVLSALATRFNTCSITETFTATALMQLVEQGKIDLLEPIGTYLPDLGNRLPYPVTLHQLLTHTSGIPNFYDLPQYANSFYNIENISELLDIVLAEPFLFEPGAQVSHSPSGYVALAAVIEAVSGQNYQSYIKTHIFEPLNMKDSGLYNWCEAVPHKATGYIFSKSGKPVLTPKHWGAFPFGADAAYCSSEDLVKFERGFLNGDLVSEELIQLMTENILFNETTIDETTWSQANNKRYGYGWKVHDIDGQQVLSQGSSMFGISVEMRSYTEDDYTIIVLSNYYHGTAQRIAEDIERCLYDEDFVVPAHPLSYFLAGKIEQQGIESVIQNFDQILKDNQLENKEVWELKALGEEYLKKDYFDSALSLFELNANNFPEEPIVYENLGEVYFKLERYEESAANFQKRLTLLPNDKRSIAMLGYIEEKKAEMKEKASKTEVLAINTTNMASPPTRSIQLEKPVNVVGSPNSKSVHTLSEQPTAKQITQKVTANTVPTSSIESDKHTIKIASTNTIPNSSVTENIISFSESSASPIKEHPTPVNEEPFDPSVYMNVDQMPSFEGGQAGIMNYISDNLQYPNAAKQNDIEGTVYVSFVVNEEGKIQDVALNKGLKVENSGCEEEALRLVNSMPMWSPGFHEGEAVKVFYTLPIKFRNVGKE